MLGVRKDGINKNFHPGNTAEYVLDRFVPFDDSCLYNSSSCEEN